MASSDIYALRTGIGPLNDRQLDAYAQLDSSITPAKAFKPEGVFSRLVSDDWFPAPPDRVKKSRYGLRYELAFNRVEAVHTGLGFKRCLDAQHDFDILFGYSTGLRRVIFGSEVSRRWGEDSEKRLRVSYRSRAAEHYDSDNVGRDLSSLRAFLGEDDYFDYYWNRSLQVELGHHFSFWNGEVVIAYNREHHSSLVKNTDFALFERQDVQRDNPSIEPGSLQSVEFRANYGGEYSRWGLFKNKRAELEIEHSPNWASDFSFTRYRLVLDWHFPTFFRRRTLSNGLDLRLVMGTSHGNLPIQRYGSLDASIPGFTPFGSFRTLQEIPYQGNHYVGLWVEHNFKAVPFELLGLWGIGKRGMGLILHGAVGRTWVERSREEGNYIPDRYHKKVGGSLQLFGLLRLDVTRRLDQREWTVGFSPARLDFLP